MCRNTRVFTEGVLSGWFSLLLWTEHRKRLGLQLKGWVRGKEGRLPARVSPGSPAVGGPPRRRVGAALRR